jgi:hypothetical protein
MTRFCMFMLVLAMAVTGCDDSPQTSSYGNLPVGATCTVQLRRDALGGAASVPVPVLTDNINGAEVSVSGTLVKVDADWVVITVDKNMLWIARPNVLLIKSAVK